MANTQPISRAATTSLIALSEKSVITNVGNSVYQPRFFSKESFGINKVLFHTLKFNKDDVERELLSSQYSFAFLRDGELRTISAFDSNDKQIPFEDFCSRLNLTINTDNLFKAGKYLSRIFRPCRYGKFFDPLNIHINDNPAYSGSVTDGISLISLRLAHTLGWKNAMPNMSAQFTLLNSMGLIKGNCVVSDKIASDVIIYSKDNVKNEITMSKDTYVSIEPLKLSEKVRLDIQSLLNLWTLFGPEQYVEWAQNGIQGFIDDLMSGRLNEWLDDFDGLGSTDYSANYWTLQKAIYHKIDYRQFPGLFRQAWSMFRQQMIKFAENKKSEPAFRIPVTFGYRGYFRVDLREHDAFGNFTPKVKQEQICLDNLGNIWIHPYDITEFLSVKGGADLDDNAVVLPTQNNQAVVWRNPNQFGEFGIHDICYEGIKPDSFCMLHGDLMPNAAKAKPAVIHQLKQDINPNPFIQGIKQFNAWGSKKTHYSKELLIRTYMALIENRASIGVVANAEMVRSSLLITNSEIFKHCVRTFDWNLEKVIDSSVKEGTDASEDMQKVYSFFRYIAENDITIPIVLKSRIPNHYQGEITFIENHPVDYLLEAVKYLINSADTLVMGQGVGKNRKPGLIDTLHIPFIAIGEDERDNPLTDIAINILKSYNRNIAIMLERTEDLPIISREILRKEEIESIQGALVSKLNDYTHEDRLLITRSWAYQIYKTARSIYDSILWVGDKPGRSGTASYTIEMLAKSGIAHAIRKDRINESNLIRESGKGEITTASKAIRVWRKEELSAEDLIDISKITIDNGTCLIGGVECLLGDECLIPSGTYQVKRIVQAVSRKDRRTFLKNSLAIYL